jgi:hypothetical protein
MTGGPYLSGTDEKRPEAILALILGVEITKETLYSLAV